MTIQKNKLLKSVLQYTFYHPAFLYVFILPVFTIVRLLGENMINTVKLLPVSISRMEYYLSVFFFIGIANLILIFVFKLMAKILYNNKHTTLALSRAISLIVSIVLIFTTYGIFYSENRELLYLVSSIHFCCIAYFSNLILLEIKNYKLNFNGDNIRLYRASNSALLSIILNLSALLVLILFNVLQLLDVREWYGNLCVILEIGLFFFLVFVKKYWKDLFGIVEKFPLVKLVYVVLTLLVGFLCCMVFAYVLFIYQNLAIILIPIVLGFTFLLTKEINKKIIFSIFSGTFSYGVIIMSLMSSFPLLIISDEVNFKAKYAALLTVEPIISVLVSLGLFLLIIKNKLSSDLLKTIKYNAISAIFIALLPIILFCFKSTETAICLLMFFLLYSLVETATQYCSRTLIINQEHHHHTVILGYYNKVVYTLFVPSLFIFIIHIIKRHFFTFSSDILVAIIIVVFIVLLFNILNLYFACKK